METNKKNTIISYVVLSILFVIGMIFNDFIGIAGIHPDILLIFLIFLTMKERPVFVIIAAFVFGLLQDMVYPGNLQFWGLSPLFKTLIIYVLIKLSPLIHRMRGGAFHLSMFGAIFVYYLLYNLLYYSGFVKPFIILYRYTLPETVYTFLIFLLLSAIFPLYQKTNR
ncbi:MAG: rod shape-determining protein MreD [FCB group bacterium]|nr:rod shape-determining protein MreD [FCB group bacterium]